MRTNSPSPPVIASDPVQIREALDQIVSSRSFSQSRRMTRFLVHVVESFLRNDPGSLKETSIGVAVFDRDPSYDPRADPVVRNEARRLRTKLEAFYAMEGSGQTLRISIPKGGYSPVFTIAGLVERTEQQSEPAALTTSQVRFPRALLVALASLAIGVIAFVIYQPRRDPDASPRLRVWRLTAFPGREVHPAFAPNESKVAFSWDRDGNFDIFTMPLEGGPVKIVSNQANDLRPAWSPDGLQIAFLRVSENGFDVMVASSSGANERMIARIDNLNFGRPLEDVTQMHGNPGPAWSRDGRYLAVTNGSGSTGGFPIHLISLETGADRVLTHPPGSAHDFYPSFSPDGRTLGFCRLLTNSTSQVFVIPVEGGIERRILGENADLRGLAWTADSRSMVVSSNRTGPHSLWKVSLRGGPPVLIPAPGASLQEPSISSDGESIVYRDGSATSELRRIPITGGVGNQSEPIAPSTHESHSAQFSPDGKNLAFVSDRSGYWEVWTSTVNGENAKRLTHFEGPLLGTVHWSPDSLRLIFDARPEGRSALFTISADGRNLRQVRKDRYEDKMPVWSNDGKLVFFNSDQGGSQQLWQVSDSGQDAQRLSDVWALDSRASPDGASVFFGGRDRGIWRVEKTGGPAKAVAGLETITPRRAWDVNRQGIWFLDSSTDRRSVWLHRFSDKQKVKMTVLDSDALFDTPSLGVSPDGRWLVFARQGESRSDLALVRGLGKR